MAKGLEFTSILKVLLKLIKGNPKYIKSIVDVTIQTRNAFFYNYDAEYDIEHSDTGDEKTTYEKDLDIETLKPNSKKKSTIIEKVITAIAFIANFISSPLVSRIILIASGAVGLYFLTTPALIGLAAAGLTVSVLHIGYKMYGQVNSYRTLKEIKEQRAILEEIMLLKTQCIALAQQTGKNFDGPHTGKLLQMLGIAPQPKPLSPNEWKQQNKFFARAAPFFKNVPEFIFPLASAIVSLNWHGVMMCVSGYLLYSCQSGFEGIAHANQMESLHQRNKSLADNIGKDLLSNGTSVEQLRETLAIARAMKSSLIELKEKKEPSFQMYAKAFDAKLNEKLEQEKKAMPAVEKTTWWQDAGKLWIKDGISLAATFRNMHPMANDYRREYMTQKIIAKSSITPDLAYETQKYIKATKGMLDVKRTNKRRLIASPDFAKKLKKLNAEYKDKQFKKITTSLIHGTTVGDFNKALVDFSNNQTGDLKTQKALATIETGTKSLQGDRLLEFHGQLVNAIGVASKKFKNKKFIALSHAVAHGATKKELDNLYNDFKQSILPTDKPREKLSKAEKDALRLANIVKFNITRVH